MYMYIYIYTYTYTNMYTYTYKYTYIYVYIYCIYKYIHMHCSFKRKMEAEAFFHNPFTFCKRTKQTKRTCSSMSYYVHISYFHLLNIPPELLLLLPTTVHTFLLLRVIRSTLCLNLLSSFHLQNVRDSEYYSILRPTTIPSSFCLLFFYIPSS